MSEYKIIDVKKTILEDNDADADKLRRELKDQKTILINIMSSPGAGKTTTLCETISRLSDTLKIGVIEADIDSDVDAATIVSTGAKAIQVHTGGMCHLDAEMTRQSLREMESTDLDLVFLENVGNLVCPAEFDTGACENVVILSVPEGDDKPLKYPLIFTKCDIALINKCDALEIFDDFDTKAVEDRIHALNPNAKVFFVSAKTGQGFEAWTSYILEKTKNWIN